MIAFELLERVWALCVGVCDYAIGRGRGNGEDYGHGSIRIDGVDDASGERGEEDARLLDHVDEDTLEEVGEEDQAIRTGRLLLRQLQHDSFHLHARLRAVIIRSAGDGDMLTEAQLRELCGTRWSFFGGSVGGTAEGKWWNDLARVWGLTAPGLARLSDDA